MTANAVLRLRVDLLGHVGEDPKLEARSYFDPIEDRLQTRISNDVGQRGSVHIVLGSLRSLHEDNDAVVFDSLYAIQKALLLPSRVG